jgi:hypothetical protein
MMCKTVKQKHCIFLWRKPRPHTLTRSRLTKRKRVFFFHRWERTQIQVTEIRTWHALEYNQPRFPAGNARTHAHTVFCLTWDWALHNGRRLHSLCSNDIVRPTAWNHKNTLYKNNWLCTSPGATNKSSTAHILIYTHRCPERFYRPFRVFISTRRSKLQPLPQHDTTRYLYTVASGVSL